MFINHCDVDRCYIDL
jgi:hypothetical protein